MSSRKRKAENKEQSKQKKVLDVAALVTKGAGLLKTLEEKGPPYVSQLHASPISWLCLQMPTLKETLQSLRTKPTV